MKRKDCDSNATATADTEIRPVSPEEIYANQWVIMDVAKRLGWDYDSRRDLVQEVALKCWNNPRFRFTPQRGSLAGYLACIARSIATDMWRKSRRCPLPMEDLELMLGADDGATGTDDEELLARRRELMARGIRELRRRYPSKAGTDAFLLFSRDGLSAREIAGRLQVKESFVNVAVHRGVGRLREIVRELARDEEWRDAC